MLAFITMPEGRVMEVRMARDLIFDFTTQCGYAVYIPACNCDIEMPCEQHPKPGRIVVRDMDAATQRAAE